MNELPPDPARLRAILRYLDEQITDTETIKIYLNLQRDAVLKALTTAENRTTNTRQAARPRRPPLETPPPRPTGYVVEQKLTEGHPLGAAIHRVDCTMTQRGTRPISADDARVALKQDARFFRACEFCRPGQELGMDLD